MKAPWILGAALAAALVAGPTVAYATTESTDTGTEAPSSLDTYSPTKSSTEPTTATSAEQTVPTTTTPTPTEQTATLPGELLAVSSQPTAPEASGRTLTENSTSTKPTAKFKYVLAVWEHPAGAPKFPQYIVQWYETNNTDVKVLNEWAIKCGTFYQSDLYANDDRTKALLAGGVLNGGMESWPKNHDGSLNMRYDTLTTPPCPIEPTTPPVTEPPVTETPTPEPTEPEVTPSPSTPLPSASPTAPSVPSDEASNPGTVTENTTPSLTTTKSDAPASPSTEQTVTGTLTRTPTTSSSLAYTGSEGTIWGVAIAFTLIVAGLIGFAVRDLARHRKNLKNK